MIWRIEDNEALRLYATPHVTNHRLYMLLHDSQYWTMLAWQNAGYNHLPWPSFFLGYRMDDPPQPNSEPVSADDE